MARRPEHSSMLVSALQTRRAVRKIGYLAEYRASKRYEVVDVLSDVASG